MNINGKAELIEGLGDAAAKRIFRKIEKMHNNGYSPKAVQEYSDRLVSQAIKLKPKEKSDVSN